MKHHLLMIVCVLALLPLGGVLAQDDDCIPVDPDADEIVCLPPQDNGADRDVPTPASQRDDLNTDTAESGSGETRANIEVDDEEDGTVTGTDDDDTIIVEDDGEIEGDGDGIVAGDGNDIIINNGEIDVDGTAIDAGDGDDRIIIDGDTRSDDGVAVDAGDGDDRITVESGDVDGVIDGGSGSDTLNFELEVEEEDYREVLTQIYEAGRSDTIDVDGDTYTFRSIEELNQALTIIREEADPNYTAANAAPFNARLNANDIAAPVAIFCKAGVIEVWDIGGGGSGSLAFAALPTAGLLQAITSGQPVVIAEGIGNQLVALPDDQIQVVALDTGYVFTFPGTACFAQ